MPIFLLPHTESILFCSIKSFMGYAWIFSCKCFLKHCRYAKAKRSNYSFLPYSFRMFFDVISNHQCMHASLFYQYTMHFSIPLHFASWFMNRFIHHYCRFRFCYANLSNWKWHWKLLQWILGKFYHNSLFNTDW